MSLTETETGLGFPALRLFCVDEYKPNRKKPFLLKKNSCLFSCFALVILYSLCTLPAVVLLTSYTNWVAQRVDRNLFQIQLNSLMESWMLLSCLFVWDNVSPLFGIITDKELSRHMEGEKKIAVWDQIELIQRSCVSSWDASKGNERQTLKQKMNSSLLN